MAGIQVITDLDGDFFLGNVSWMFGSNTYCTQIAKTKLGILQMWISAHFRYIC